MIGIDGRFGASAPGATVLKNLGITAEHIVERTLAVVGEFSKVAG